MTAAVALPVDDRSSSQEWSWWLRDLEAAVGPIVSGRVYVVGARPSCGKTALLMNLFWKLGVQLAEDPHPGDLLSCWTERSRIAAMASLASLMCGYDEDNALRGKWAGLPPGAKERMGRIIADLEAGAEWSPTIDAACPTSEQIAKALETHRPRVFVLDYLQKVRPTNRQTTFDAWLAVMTHCTQYAADGGTVIIGSQLKRKADGVFDKYRPPFMEDFKGGGAIEEGANLALGLYRPLRKMTRAEETEVKSGRQDLQNWQQPGVMAIKVLKHTFWGTAADRIIRVKVAADRRITDYGHYAPPPDIAPFDAGDAWEAS